MDSPALKEGGKNRFTVTHHGWRSVSVLFVNLGRQTSFQNVLSPFQLAALPGKTEDRLNLLSFVRRSEKDPVANDRGRRMTSSGHFDLPNNVLRFTPGNRWLFGFRCLSVFRRTAPKWPVSKSRKGKEKEQDNQRQSHEAEFSKFRASLN